MAIADKIPKFARRILGIAPGMDLPGLELVEEGVYRYYPKKSGVKHCEIVCSRAGYERVSVSRLDVGGARRSAGVTKFFGRDPSLVLAKGRFDPGIDRADYDLAATFKPHPEEGAFPDRVRFSRQPIGGKTRIVALTRQPSWTEPYYLLEAGVQGKVANLTGPAPFRATMDSGQIVTVPQSMWQFLFPGDIRSSRGAELLVTRMEVTVAPYRGTAGIATLDAMLVDLGTTSGALRAGGRVWSPIGGSLRGDFFLGLTALALSLTLAAGLTRYALSGESSVGTRSA